MKRSSFNHEDFSTSRTLNDRVIDGCFLRKETTEQLVHFKAFQVESDSFSFSVTYQTNLEIRHNRDGNKIETLLEHPGPKPKLEHNIPKQFLVSKETCIDHVMIVLSEMHLPPSIQERLVQYISTESVKFRSGGGGGGLKIDVKVEVKEERGEKRQVMATDCQICLTDLYSAGSRMELNCCHVFHRDCVMKWLKRNPSCPICRAKATVSLF
ncbi:unnamed protein product [Microthlaspi erraticum]|uniref:RING-type domain-containing protein n=1 Tax=Microthlaspi erraticum TaxID=1685480 RepID=A0A6D2IC90_9BRAS|nr:unnamed protein product [Microthlaspi erraticum]